MRSPPCPAGPEAFAGGAEVLCPKGLEAHAGGRAERRTPGQKVTGKIIIHCLRPGL